MAQNAKPRAAAYNSAKRMYEGTCTWKQHLAESSIQHGQPKARGESGVRYRNSWRAVLLHVWSNRSWQDSQNVDTSGTRGSQKVHSGSERYQGIGSFELIAAGFTATVTCCNGLEIVVQCWGCSHVASAILCCSRRLYQLHRCAHSHATQRKEVAGTAQGKTKGRQGRKRAAFGWKGMKGRWLQRRIQSKELGAGHRGRHTLALQRRAMNIKLYLRTCTCLLHWGSPEVAGD